MNKVAPVDYGSEAVAMQAYLEAGEERARQLGNRGPIRFGADGLVHPDILEAYWRCGFYVFEGVLGAAELADIEADLRRRDARDTARADAPLVAAADAILLDTSDLDREAAIAAAIAAVDRGRAGSA